MNDSGTQGKTDSVQYLTFMLGGELFALNILSTREVLMTVKITPIPETPDYMAGVINLRGTVVPVLDLRKKFRLPVTLDATSESIIITEVSKNGEMLVVGTLVDAVRGVMHVDRSMLGPPPKVGMKLNTELIDVLARKDDGFVIVLNADKIISEEELGKFAGERNGPESAEL